MHRIPGLLSLALLLVLLWSTSVFAVEIRSLDEGQSPPPATVEDLAWLQGRWVGEALGGQVEEIYGAPRGGRIMGCFGLVQEGQANFYEFILIQEHEGSLVLRLKHFHADFAPWEAADETVDFPLVHLDEKGAWFDGLTMERQGDDRMLVAVRTDGGGALEFPYRRD